MEVAGVEVARADPAGWAAASRAAAGWVGRLAGSLPAGGEGVAAAASDGATPSASSRPITSASRPRRAAPTAGGDPEPWSDGAVTGSATGGAGMALGSHEGTSVGIRRGSLGAVVPGRCPRGASTRPRPASTAGGSAAQRAPAAGVHAVVGPQPAARRRVGRADQQEPEEEGRDRQVDDGGPRHQRVGGPPAEVPAPTRGSRSQRAPSPGPAAPPSGRLPRSSPCQSGAPGTPSPRCPAGAGRGTYDNRPFDTVPGSPPSGTFGPRRPKVPRSCSRPRQPGAARPEGKPFPGWSQWSSRPWPRPRAGSRSVLFVHSLGSSPVRGPVLSGRRAVAMPAANFCDKA